MNKSTRFRILVVSYEMMVKHSSAFNSAPVDLIIADEAHRLKTDGVLHCTVALHCCTALLHCTVALMH